MENANNTKKLQKISENIRTLYMEKSLSNLDVGLFHGKMGICIYFFHLFQITKDPQYKDYANTLIKNILSGILKSIPNDYSIEKGVTGIGIGIEYLAQKGFIEGDTDELLKVLDDAILGGLSFTILNDPSASVRPLMDILVYLFLRIKNRKPDHNPDLAFILKNGAMYAINDIERQFKRINMYYAPPIFTVLWFLPVYLCLLSEIYKLNIYNNKIERIINGLSETVLSNFPILHSNRMYLSYAIKKVTDQIPLPLWEKHSTRLASSVDIKKMVDSEFKNRQIDVKNGIIGIYFITALYAKLTQDLSIIPDRTELLNKLANSDIWKDSNLLINKEYFNYDGIAGIAGIDLAIYYLINEI